MAFGQIGGLLKKCNVRNDIRGAYSMVRDGPGSDIHSDINPAFAVSIAERASAASCDRNAQQYASQPLELIARKAPT
ncbi:hypothetical protein BRAS3809_4220005 [Bradyrhizobium sp. STM 3809]|nr:hypothetical protein BRAS3809_4220005 [Bradyrhizobium sp. STM 3809]